MFENQLLEAAIFKETSGPNDRGQINSNQYWSTSVSYSCIHNPTQFWKVLGNLLQVPHTEKYSQLSAKHSVNSRNLRGLLGTLLSGYKIENLQAFGE